MSNINFLINNQDNAEKIRDRIAAILTLELQRQKELAIENTVEDLKDFDIGVFLENARPWALTGDKNPFPLINICLAGTREDTSPGSTANNIKYIGTYTIDCYGCGNFKAEADEELPDDSLSALRAWKTVRIARNVLMSGFYTFLGMRGIVRRRRILKIDTIIPQGLAEAAIAITAARLTFEVEFFEQSPQAEATELEEISFKADDSGEVNLIDI